MFSFNLKGLILLVVFVIGLVGVIGLVSVVGALLESLATSIKKSRERRNGN